MFRVHSGDLPSHPGSVVKLREEVAFYLKRGVASVEGGVASSPACYVVNIHSKHTHNSDLTKNEIC